MRTKTLILAAAALAAGLATSSAQVYSANIVGYYVHGIATNITGTPYQLTNGYNMVGNQMDVDGTYTNNTLATVFGAYLPNGTKVLAFNGVGFSQTTYSTNGSKWTGGAATNAIDIALNPGHGVFVQIPALPAKATSVTVLGQVWPGTIVQPIAAGLQIVSSAYPKEGGIGSTFGYVATPTDKVLRYNQKAQAYYNQKTYGSGGTWAGTQPAAGEPSAFIGEAFFLNAKGATNWSQTFTNTP
jgi:hypothetical protein